MKTLKKNMTKISSQYTRKTLEKNSYKCYNLLIKKFIGKNLCQSLFFNKIASLRLQFYQKEILTKVFFCEFCEIFKNTFSAEHHRVTASDIRMQVVVICDLNLSLQLVTINFTFFLLRVFMLAHALHNAPVLLRQFAF